MQNDIATANAFATSWNHVEVVYTADQVREWLSPLDPEVDIRGHEVIELGFGNGSLLCHVATFLPKRLAGVELGDTIEQTRRNLTQMAPSVHTELQRGDLTTVNAGQFDVVYCIGVIHHLASPAEGFAAVLRHAKPGGRFHCWVYAHEGNTLIRLIVEPVRRIASRLPWWLNKYFIALPMVTPYFLFAKSLRAMNVLTDDSPLRWLPLFRYTQWIAGEPFRFFHHVAFDQLVTPRTSYIRRAEVDEWLRNENVDTQSTYVIFRNGNSWKFGGRRTTSSTNG